MKYIDLVFQLANGQEKHAYIPCKDLFDPYNGEKAIRIEYDTADHKNYIRLILHDPENLEALVQTENGLRIMKGSISQSGVVKLSGETLATIAADEETAMTPADVLTFIRKSRAPGYQGFNEYNDTTLDAINELATTRIVEAGDDERDAKDLATYKLVRTQKKDIAGNTENVPKGETIHEHKVIWQIDAFAEAVDPADYELYRLTTLDTTSLPGTYHPGLYMYTTANGWERVGGGEAIVKVRELPEENIREDVFYQLNRKATILGRYGLTEEAKENGWKVLPEGLQRDEDTVISWEYVGNNWSSYWNSIIYHDPMPNGMIVAYYYDDEDPSVTTHVGYDWFPRFGTIWYYYDNEWAEVWTKYSKRYVDAESFVTQDPENRGMTWIVNESGTWELGPAGGLAIVDELPPIEDAVYGSAYFLKAPWFDEENQVFYDRATYSPAMNDEGAVDHYVITGMPSDNAYDTITEKDKHIYDLTYSKLDYDFAKEYSGEVYEGLCSAFVKNGVLYRNYDWTYDDAVSFTVYTPATPGGRHAVMGVAGTFPELTPEFVDSGAYSPLYKVVPYRLVDGINDAGVSMCHLVCPFEDGDVPTTGTKEGRPRVNARYAARYILDKADNFDYAVSIFLNTNWFVDDKVREGKHEFHYLLTDGTKSAICYFKNNENKATYFNENIGLYSRPIMTNFRMWYDAQPELKEGKYVYAPGMGATPTSKGLTPNAGGAERYNEIVDIYETVHPNDGFYQSDFIRKLGYTHVYTDKLRASDLVGIGTLTIDSPITEFENISAVVKGMFVDAERDGTFWQTVHTSIYDCTTKAMRVFPQEMDYNSPDERFANFYDYKFPVSEGHWIQRVQNIDSVFDDEKSIALESDTGLARYKSGGKWVAIDNKIYITYYDYRILKNKNELIDGVDYIIIDPTL